MIKAFRYRITVYGVLIFWLTVFLTLLTVLHM